MIQERKLIPILLAVLLFLSTGFFPIEASYGETKSNAAIAGAVSSFLMNTTSNIGGLQMTGINMIPTGEKINWLTKHNVELQSPSNNNPVKVPIVTYHHIVTNVGLTNNIIITPEKFRSDMEAIKKAGFTTILFKDLVNYVEGKGQLPQKPVLITFDDGYYSNYEYAYPILKELDMKATISIIGWAVGETKHKVTGREIIPRFTWEEAKEMIDSGHIDIQNHTYDMHNPRDQYPYRRGVLQKEEESLEDYIEAFREDVMEFHHAIEENLGNDVFVFVYPHGEYNDLTEELLVQLGYRVTLTGEHGVNLITRDKNSLFKLKRINAGYKLPSEELVRRISR
ncbi:polysaccharide deacetylase family protein [Natronincola ferrireducens]|uniref:Polysaccharide deacetylase n=1 Tax=Natronincola ferrireducens TaxID=393762 RepID=A0A1G8X0H8_9FIRM|nr:polysaccharide deacetylase family protein [Natronincola ferrireducens]SDJ84149.1 Polysaccharide deacetylase [Natronincola ferrireducens]